MLTKTQLQAEVQNLKARLKEFWEKLNNCKEVTIEVTIETAEVGDTLEDGSIVLQKSDGLALLVAPQSTEVVAKWTKEFSEVFDSLKSQGFSPSQWFIPTEEQLQLAYRNVHNEFSSTPYWSSTEGTATLACGVYFGNGDAGATNKARRLSVRAFRCVTY